MRTIAKRANDESISPHRLFRSALPPGTLHSLAITLKKRWKRYRKELKRCQHKFSEEAVHQSRVETRRLLALIELLSPFLAEKCVKKARGYLKRHLDTFDDLRDTQVQLKTVGRLLRVYPAAREFQNHLCAREARLSRATRKEIKRIKSRRLAKLIAACRKELKKWRAQKRPRQSNELLWQTVQSAFEHTRRLRQRIRADNTATIHGTRIAFKRFRYMVETLADFLPMANARLLSKMHDYQTMMGDIQDAEVLLQAFDKFLRQQQASSVPARRLHAELLRRRQNLIRIFLRAADQLLEFWPAAAAPVSRPQLVPTAGVASSVRAFRVQPNGHEPSAPLGAHTVRRKGKSR